ncbi:DNA topoisomerase, partial [Clostridium botulinum]
YTLKLGKSINKTLSIGRCQTPILNLIVERDLERENFKAMLFYEVIINTGEFKATYIKDNNTKIEDREIAEIILNNIKGNLKIEKVNKEIKKIKSPKFFNLTDLQKVMSNKYEFTEDKTLKIAQKLYEEKKILSYPRTNSNHLTEALAEQFENMLQILKFDKFKNIINKISNEDINKVRKDKSFINSEKVTDHYSLSPTQNRDLEKIYNELSTDEKLLFDEVTLRFLSSFYSEYEYEVTTILSNVNEYNFIFKGNVEIKKGWKNIYTTDEEEIEK